MHFEKAILSTPKKSGEDESFPKKKTPSYLHRQKNIIQNIWRMKERKSLLKWEYIYKEKREVQPIYASLED